MNDGNPSRDDPKPRAAPLVPAAALEEHHQPAAGLGLADGLTELLERLHLHAVHRADEVVERHQCAFELFAG